CRCGSPVRPPRRAADAPGPTTPASWGPWRSLDVRVRVRLRRRALRRPRDGRGGSGRLPGVLLAEALDASRGVHELLLPGEERVAVGADIEVEFAHRGARLPAVAAGALHGRGGVLGMDVGFH